MKILSHSLFLAAAALVAPVHSRAAFDSAIVSSDAKWVVYADLNGLRETTLGKQLIDSAGKAAQFKIPNLDLRLDVPKILATVGSVTAYGTNLSPDAKLIDGALILRGTPDLRKITEAVLVQANLMAPDKVDDAKDFPFSTYSIGDQLLVGFPAEPIVIVSKSKAQLLKALEVFRGSSPSVARDTSSPLTALVGNAGKSIVFAASMVPSDAVFTQGGPQARILRMTNSGSIALGESGAQTFAHVQLLARSSEMADKLTKILQGLTALLSLGESNDKALADFLNSANVQRTQNAVSLNLRYSSDRLAEMIKNLQKQPVAAGHRPRINIGKVVLEWQSPVAAAEADSEDGTPAPSPLAWKSTESVHLVNGAFITFLVSGARGSHARFDRIEIAPADGSGTPLVFRPNFMRLSGFRTVSDRSHPGAKLAETVTGAFATAAFDFPGEDGDYKLRIHYSETPSGKASFSIGVRNPAPAPTETATRDDAVRAN